MRNRLTSYKLLYLFIGLILAATSLGLAAQERQRRPLTVRIEAKKAGELPYRSFYRGQQRLLSYLPPEPRHIDLWLQATYAGMSEAERDAYEPKGWGVTILSESVDEDLPVRRGGYFRLPFVAPAYKENAVILFKEPSRRGWVHVQWELRVGADRRIGYAALDEAFGALRAMQKKIPAYATYMEEIKWAEYDGIKACFRERGGAILVNGRPAATAAAGNCRALKIERGRFDPADLIEFSGALDIVTFVITNAG